MEILSENRIAILVDDKEAVYPIRIDPTFSDANWVGLGSGLNGNVYALLYTDGKLYVGGNFTSAGGNSANYIALWDGSSWSALTSGVGGLGVNTLVRAIALSGNDIYVGGNFITAGGNSANYIARWDGASWTTLGSGVNSTVYSISVSGGEIYVGGLFTYAGGNPAERIAKWNGSAWSSLGAGANGLVTVLLATGNTVYAGGQFSQAGGISAQKIAKWNGSSWSSMGTLNNRPWCLALHEGNLFAGGEFGLADGMESFYISKWNGSAWEKLGDSGVTLAGGPVYSIISDGSNLLIGGAFGGAYNPGYIQLNNISKWDGTRWTPLGNGLNGTCYALATSGVNLYAGGNFTAVGGNSVSKIAKAESLVANDHTVTRAPGVSAKIPITDIAGDLLFGNSVSIDSLGSSGQGAAISSNASYIFYTPANNNSDNFTYTVSNGSGTATGTITVSVAASEGYAKTISVSGGSATLKFFGIPGIQYEVQRTTSLVDPVSWTTLTGSPLSPGADGSFSFTDSSAPEGTAYYRSLQH